MFLLGNYAHDYMALKSHVIPCDVDYDEVELEN